jgi:hypothetical protein
MGVGMGEMKTPKCRYCDTIVQDEMENLFNLVCESGAPPVEMNFHCPGCDKPLIFKIKTRFAISGFEQITVTEENRQYQNPFFFT